MTLQEKITKALEQGRVEGARKLTAQLLQQEDKQTWDKARRDEYITLFPEFREMTADEKLADNEQFTEDNPKPDDYVHPQVLVDYSEDVDFISYTDWLNETKVVTPAVEEESHLEWVDGNQVKVVDIPFVPEVTETVRPYTALTILDTDIETKLSTFNAYSTYTKEQKVIAKENVTVTHNTVEYQGDPMSINYMSAVGAVGAMRMFQVLVQSGVITQEQYDLVYKTNEYWKGADNEIHNVQIESVVEACELAMIEQAKVVGAK